MPEGQPGDSSFAQRLDELFRTRTNPQTGQPYTLRFVAAQLTRQGCAVSHAHLGKLRKGEAGDPRRSEMAAIAKFFGVPVSFFTDDVPESGDEPSAADAGRERLRRALERPGIQQIALRMADAEMSDDAVNAVAEMVEQVARLEGAARLRQGTMGSRAKTIMVRAPLSPQDGSDVEP